MLVLYTHLPFTIAYIDLSFRLARLVAPFFIFRNIAQVTGESKKETLDFISRQGIFPDMSHQRWIMIQLYLSITCVYRLIKRLERPSALLSKLLRESLMHLKISFTHCWLLPCKHFIKICSCDGWQKDLQIH